MMTTSNVLKNQSALRYCATNRRRIKYHRRVISRRRNILAQTTNCHSTRINPTDVRTRFVRFAYHHPDTSISNCELSDNKRAVPLGSAAFQETKEVNTNNDLWYTPKEYCRILSENACIIALARKLLRDEGFIDEDVVPVQGLECYLSPDQAKLRQRKVANHARRILQSLRNV